MPRRGSSPSWMACRVKEKAPVITAWLAITVATVASSTIGISAQLGIEPIEGVLDGLRVGRAPARPARSS